MKRRKSLGTILNLHINKAFLRGALNQFFGAITGLDASHWSEGLQAPALRSYALTRHKLAEQLCMLRIPVLADWRMQKSRSTVNISSPLLLTMH